MKDFSYERYNAKQEEADDYDVDDDSYMDSYSVNDKILEKKNSSNETTIKQSKSLYNNKSNDTSLPSEQQALIKKKLRAKLDVER